LKKSIIKQGIDLTIQKTKQKRKRRRGKEKKINKTERQNRNVSTVEQRAYRILKPKHKENTGGGEIKMTNGQGRPRVREDSGSVLVVVCGLVMEVLR
jgi:hypothetical protein